MVAEAVAETALVSQEPDRHDVFLRLIEQFEPALRRLAAAYFDREADRADLFQDSEVILVRQI
jgi:DNA-directed RNA polymerase specialized sigma24 family protein